MDPQYVSLRWWFRGSHKPAGNFPRIIPLVTPTRADQRFTSAVFSSRRERALSLLYYVRWILFRPTCTPFYLSFERNNGARNNEKKKNLDKREIWNFKRHSNNILLIKLLVNDIPYSVSDLMFHCGKYPGKILRINAYPIILLE